MYTAVVVDVEQPEFWAYPEPGLTDEELEAKKKWHSRWIFHIEGDPEWEGREMRTKRISIQAAGPKANTTKLNMALFGEAFDPNRRYKASDTIGQRCQIVVKVNERGYSDIVDFLELRKPRAAAMTPEEKRAELERQLKALEGEAEQSAFDGMPEAEVEIPF